MNVENPLDVPHRVFARGPEEREVQPGNQSNRCKYDQQTVDALSMGALVGGIFKGSVYGALVAVSGCMRGMQSGRSASSVGDAATSAVVTGIVAIIAACGLFSVVFYVLGF